MKNDESGRKHGRKNEAESKLDESSEESFPASDAPSWTSGVSRKEGADAGTSGRTEYQVRAELKPKGLSGIGEDQIAQHWKLYEGYVKNVNLLNKKIAALRAAKDFGPEFAELTRRLGFEYDGMILHEHYFGVLKAGVKAPAEDGALGKHLKKCFGGVDAGKEEFTAIAKMRGGGWAILYYDPRSRQLSNHWIGLHEDGHPSGYTPILVLDVWEHAFMVDAGADGRPKYVEAFFKNVDWAKVERCLAEAERAAQIVAAV